MQTMREFQEEFDRYFSSYITTAFQQFNALHHHFELTDYANHVKKLIAGGKRLRPYMCFLGRECGDSTETIPATPLYIGLELFHVFCLIHDDIIDRSSVCRGVPTLHAYIEQSLAKHIQNQEKRRHYSEGKAMLFGDLIYKMALEQLTFIPNANIREEVFAMIDEVVAGQMIDVQTTVLTSASDQDIERKMYYKTTSYTFIRPFRIGLALAGIPSSERTRLSVFAEHLGRAFQIQDDYLDLTGNPEITGKPILSDIREGQHTLFSNDILKHADETLKKQFNACFGKEVKNETLLELQLALKESSLLHTTRQEFERAYQDALTHLEQLDMKEDVKKTLIALTEKLIVRVK